MTLRRTLRRLASTLRPARPRPVEVTVTDPAEIPPLLYWATFDRGLRIHLPTRLLSSAGAYAYGGGWHPFIAALAEGPDALAWYYDHHRPADIGSFYFLPEHLPTPGVPPWEIPWILRDRRLPPGPEGGLDPSHGISYYGPATPQKVALEHQRLTSTLESIRRDGYQPDLHGDIEGFFLRRGPSFRFFVRGGKHRAAALAFLGRKTIPVRMRPDWPRVIDAASVQDWPLVRDGSLSADAASCIHQRFFEFTGLQQRQALLDRPARERHAI